jgi:hypothetical protein
VRGAGLDLAAAGRRTEWELDIVESVAGAQTGRDSLTAEFREDPDSWQGAMKK